MQHAETIVVEATERLLDGRFKRFGVAGAGELFDAKDFLESLSSEHLSLAIQNGDLFKE